MADINGPDPEDLARLNRKIKALTERLTVEMRRALQVHGDDFDRQMQDRFRGPLPVYGQPNTSPILASRTGQLKRSLRHEVVGNKLSDVQLLISVGVGLPYAALQEYGGVVRPVRAKYLAIPIEENLTPAGVRRRPSPRDYPEGAFHETPDGKLFFGLRQPDDTWKNLFALRKSVRIPPRLGFYKTINAPEMRTKLQRRIASAVKRAVEAA